MWITFAEHKWVILAERRRYSTYQYVKSKAGATDHYQRFFDSSGNINLMQIAEYLPNPPEILYGSYTTGTWQDGTLSAAANCAAGSPGAIEQLD